MLTIESKRRTPDRIGSDLTTDDDREHQQDEADDRYLTHLTGPQVAAVNTHENGNGYRGAHREGTPRALSQRLDNDQRKHRQQNRHDHEGAEEGNHTGHDPEFGFDHVAQRTAITTGRDEQNHEVLHSTRENHARQNPHHAG